jgi:hypothetical protein
MIEILLVTLVIEEFLACVWICEQARMQGAQP